MPDADLVLTGADVYAVDAARRWSQGVAVRGSRIVAVGTEDEVRDLIGPSTVHLHLPGRMVLPGFQDAHIHAAFGGRNLLSLNLDELDTRERYLDAIAAHAAAHPELPWITGGGWYGAVFGEAGPRREDLDAVVPDRPVFLMNTDVHGAWVNTRALEAGGISAATPDPWDGYYPRDPDGSPTGMLHEGAAYAFAAGVVPPTDAATWRASLLRAQAELHALGITGWQDAWVEPDLLTAYRALDDAGELTAKVVASLWWDRHRGPEQIDELVTLRDRGTGGLVDAGTVKIMLDGCPENGTAAMLRPFAGPVGEAHGTGISFVEPAALTQAVTRLDALGFQVHMHALGDRALRMALDAVEAARAANGSRDARHHIAHLQVTDPADLPRLRELGIVANMQPYWAQLDRSMRELTLPALGEERVSRLYPIGTVARTGAVLAFGSDWPVSTPNPLLEIEVAVTRVSPAARGGEPFQPEERIGLPAALAAFTRGAAYVNRDDEAGTIAPGMRADLAVLDRNVFDAGPIGDAQVELTIASGEVVYDRDG
ncbi:MAG: amidohydrolase [Actinomycetota bacterium]|nr:amidohydrolase [Actinomycetota bacterium]